MSIAIEYGVHLLLVYDVPTSLRFYRDVLGYTVMQHSEPFDRTPDNFGWCMLRHGNAWLMLNNMYEDNIRPAVPDAERARYHGDSALYLNCPDVDVAYAELIAKGIAADAPRDTYYGMRQVSMLDPDGYPVILQRPVA